jgi:hypothetical protein
MAPDVLEAEAGERAAASCRSSGGEHKAKYSVCFLFAMVIVWASLFSTGAPCAAFRAVF